MDVDESVLEHDSVFRYLRSLALCHMVVCFDLNSKPDCQSPIINNSSGSSDINNYNDNNKKKKKSQSTVIDELHGETDHCKELINSSKRSKLCNGVNDKRTKMVHSINSNKSNKNNNK